MLNDLYDYPVMITKEDVKNYIGIDLDSIDDGDKILIDAHRHIYDYLIYPTFNADIKNRIINKYMAELEKPLKRAILLQVDYLVTNETNIGMWNGMLRVGQNIDKTELQEILTKVICPEIINTLKGAPINLLYAGD